MAEKLTVELRQEFGKGAARRIRAGGKVPAVLYEHGNDPVHLELPGHDIALAARNPNALLSLKISDGTEHLALIKDIQRHPLKRTLTHLDLIIVRKRAARRIRAGGKVPAVLYEHGNDPVHLELPGHDIALAARNPNALLSLKISDGTEHLALIKDIQRHPLKRTLTHLDLIIVRKGEKVEVDIPVIVEGEPVAPAVAFVDLQELTLLVDALNVPEQIEIDVDETEDGYQ